VPRFLSFKIAEDFVVSKMKWINKNLTKIQSQEKLQTNFNIGNIFRTRFHSIYINSTLLTNNSFFKENEYVEIYISWIYNM
jgi:predicted metal-dependent hydrolase